MPTSSAALENAVVPPRVLTEEALASLAPLDQKSANGALSFETLVFEAFHAGANPHAFDNYLTAYSGFLLEAIRQKRAPGWLAKAAGLTSTGGHA